jgi:ribosomal protein L7/L12
MIITRGANGFVLCVGAVEVPIKAVVEALSVCREGQIIPAVKLVRAFTGLSLTESRDIVVFVQMAQSINR